MSFSSPTAARIHGTDTLYSYLVYKLPHIASIKTELGWESHRGAESEGVPIQSWIEQLAHARISLAMRLSTLLCVRRRLLSWRGACCWWYMHRSLWLLRLLLLLNPRICRRIWIRSRCIGLGIIKHLVGRVVLLFCTHGLNLGRQSSIRGRKKRVSLPSCSM